MARPIVYAPVVRVCAECLIATHDNGQHHVERLGPYLTNSI